MTFDSSSMLLSQNLVLITNIFINTSHNMKTGNHTMCHYFIPTVAFFQFAVLKKNLKYMIVFHRLILNLSLFLGVILL